MWPFLWSLLLKRPFDNLPRNMNQENKRAGNSYKLAEDNINRVLAAAERINNYTKLTPVLQNEKMDQLAGIELFFKCENLQETGAFKARGATNAVLRAFEDKEPLLENGVIGSSSGNHGIALSRICKMLDIPCTVVSPKECPESKRSKIKSNGARLIITETYKEILETCQCIAENEKLFYVKTADSMDLISGQGTIGLELMKQVPDLDAVLITLNGGGMLSGCSIAMKAMNPKIKPIAVEPEGKELSKSLRAKKRLWPLEEPRFLNTKAEGINGEMVAALPFDIIKDLLEPDDVITVTDQEMIQGMKMAAEHLKLVIEMSAGAAIAASLKVKKTFPELNKIGVILCGGNVDFEQFVKIITHKSE